MPGRVIAMGVHMKDTRWWVNFRCEEGQEVNRVDYAVTLATVGLVNTDLVGTGPTGRDVVQATSVGAVCLAWVVAVDTDEIAIGMAESSLRLPLAYDIHEKCKLI